MRKIIYYLLMLLPIVANAHDFEVDGIYYNIINDSEATVTFQGPYYDSDLDEYTGEVVIPETVTYNGVTYNVISIGNYAFSKCGSLIGVKLPNSITSIYRGAFEECNALSSITIPDSVTLIGDEAFRSCTGLTNLTIGNNVTEIGGYAFCECIALKSFDIPNAVTLIREFAFTYCTSLTSIRIPNSVRSIGNGAFSGCSGLKDIEVVGDNQYYDSRENCNAIIETSSNTLIAGCQSTFIPNTITSIGVNAFNGCTGLTTITIPNTVSTIGIYAFRDCAGLKSMTIPNSVLTIEQGAFSGCKALKSIEIPNSVTFIGKYAFAGCEQLTSIVIPKSVINLGEYAFNYCSGLNSIEIPNSISSIGFGAFNRCTPQKLIITGEGEGRGSAINCESSYLYIDSQITSLKGVKVNPKSAVYCFAPTPPTCDAYTFTNYSGWLFVPASSLSAYFTAEYWSNFTNIAGYAVEPEEVSISQDSIEVNLGNQYILMASVTPANSTPNSVTWRSTNIHIAAVNNNGTVFSVGAGECDIIAECLYRRDTCHVVVMDSTVTITLDQQEAMVLPNHIITLSPSASPIMPDLSVTSTDPSVAAARVVNKKVQVVGIKEGTTTITVGSVDGTAIPATCFVTVYTEPGDLDCDGFVNISDVTDLIDYLLGGDDSQISTKNADVNGDGSINISDVTDLIDILLSGN